MRSPSGDRGLRLPLEPAVEGRRPDERLARSKALRAWLEAGDPAASPPAPHGLPPRVADWPEDALATWHERAGIMEFDGGLPRHVAEREAERLVREQLSGTGPRGPPTPGRS